MWNPPTKQLTHLLHVTIFGGVVSIILVIVAAFFCISQLQSTQHSNPAEQIAQNDAMQGLLAIGAVAITMLLGLGWALQRRLSLALTQATIAKAQGETAVQNLQVQHAAQIKQLRSTFSAASGAQLEQMENLKRRHQVLFDSLPVAVCLKDPQGKYLDMNAAWENVFACSAAQMRGKTDADLFCHAPDLASLRLAQHQVLCLDQGMPQYYGLRLTLAQGQERKLSFQSARYCDARGLTLGVIEITLDESQRAELEADLNAAQAELNTAKQNFRYAQEQLVQSDKMASIGQLAAGVAHEINNPVGYVYSNLNSLDRYVKDVFAVLHSYEAAESAIADPNLQAAIGREKQAAEIDYLKQDLPSLLAESREGLERVKKIVQDLKDFSRKSSDDEAWQITDLHKCLDSTLNIVWNELKYKCELRRDYGSLPEVECLPSQLNQVLMNILVNAGHAIQNHGTVTVATGLAGDQVWIAISDSGAGIPAENLSRIFDPFFTTKPVGQGTGLGLALSYSIIQKHNGHIEVESEVGVGTTFRIWLPTQHLEHAQAA